MLETQTRTLFREALLPPLDYRIDRVFGTTFTMDLAAMLIVPFAMTFGERDAGAQPDVLALLESVRRNASRITVFCQEDRIAVPRTRQTLFAYIEPSVIPVRPPPSGSFHPKVWALRFTSPGRPVKYRLLVLSRNLTFDHSWDTVLSLEGEVMNRAIGYTSNRPIADFFAALPGMASVPLAPAQVEGLELMTQEMRKVRFVLPEGIQSLDFLPLMPRRQINWPFDAVPVDRMLVISRFVSEGCLQRLASSGRGNVLVSDFLTLAEIRPAFLSGYERVTVLSDQAEPDPAAEDEIASTEGEPMEAPPPLSGLHAKVYAADSGAKGYVWTGSANATEAAFRNNVEFMVRLQGPKSRCGVDAVLGREDISQSLSYLLQPYVAETYTAPDASVKALELRLEEARREIAASGLIMQAQDGGDGTFDVGLQIAGGSSFQLPPGVTGECRPITLATTWTLPGSVSGPATVISFGNLTLKALTCFVSIDLVAAIEGRSMRTSFTLKLPLEGAPADREQLLLTSILENREAVQRYILLLLSDAASTPGEIAALTRALDPGASSESNGEFLHMPVFEMMLRALNTNPESLNRVAEVFEALSKTEAGRALLPPGFSEVWQPLWQVSQEGSRAS